MKQEILKDTTMDREIKNAVRRSKKIKPNTKETTTMKTSSKKTVIVTVLLTLLTLVAIAAQAFYFYQLGADTQKSENERIRAEVVKQVAQLKNNQ